MQVPVTSKTMLRDIGASARSPRWAEFVARYKPIMERHLASRFPDLAAEADDVLQETFLAVSKAIPDYRHVPGEKGAFHNYLTGMLRNKAADARRRRAADAAGVACGGAVPPRAAEPPPWDYGKWRDAVFEIALRQLLADESVQERTKQVFERVALRGEDPASVALAFGIERNAVDQMKSRMTAKLRRMVASLSEEGPPHAPVSP